MTTHLQHPRVISIASGKGGVGKTNLAVNLAVSFAGRGKRVLLVDADLGLANVDVLLDERPRYTLRHVMNGERTAEEAIVTSPYGVSVLAGASGVPEVADAASPQRQRLLASLEPLAGRFDIVLVDTAAGIASSTLFFAAAAHDVLVVTTPEPTALTDAYATIKVLAQRYAVQRVGLVLNHTASDADARDLFGRLSMLTGRFLPVLVDFVGRVPSDEHVRTAVMGQQPVVVAHPNAPASLALRRLADTLAMRPPAAASGAVQLFWRELSTAAPMV